jgi:biopolymer transport protein ExbD
MQFKKRDKNDSFSIDIAPLVDVVFLLLIFFMLSTSFEINPGLKVNLPESSTKELEKKPKNIKIVITKRGEIFFNNKKSNLQKLDNEFKRVKNKKMLIIIQADKYSYHGTVVSVMDIAKKNGLNNFAIATKLKQ